MELNPSSSFQLRSESQSDDSAATTQVSQAWDAAYKKGRYGADPALEFTNEIIKRLKASPNLVNGRGLYVGCGNGRNYIKLAESGLDMTGLDVSGVALAELSKKLPQCVDRLHLGDFLDYRNDSLSQDTPFQYIIAIQVLQHGNQDRVRKYFEKVSMLLESGGLLFLRVNASNTDVQHDHDVIEKNDEGGFTVRYKEGPKKGLDIHFYSKKDVCNLVCKNNMSVMQGLKNVKTERVPPGTGSWSQWEMVAKKI